MIKSTGAKFSRVLGLLISLTLLYCIIACGNGATTSDGTGSNTTTTDLSSLTLTLSSSIVSSATPVTVTATLRDQNGNLVDGAVVTFAATSSLVAFSPTSATALTYADTVHHGVASITLNAASLDSAGATTISASATFTSGSTTKTVTSAPIGISVNGATLSLGAITLGSSSISAYGTSSVSVPVYVDAVLATVPISVTFTSPCVSAGKASLSSPVTTIAGTATSTYKDNGCGTGSDTIMASVTGASVSRTITVNLPATSNIQFISATPTIIGTSTASSSSLPTSSLVRFRVVDSSNNGKSGVLVNFTVVPESKPGGLSLSALSATSDADGYVSVSLSSGTVPTPVWVVATVDGTTLKSQSNTLTITTGLPTQDFFSLSVQTYNIEGWNYDGTTSALLIIASDRMGNPVPDGTAINFITEGAQITPGSCTTTNGTCSVTFKSAESRPSDGRVSILAYAIGEKSFADADNSNSYTAGETFYDIGDPYVDYNENGLYDTGEFSIASTTAGSSACLTQPSATALPARYANALSRENTCTAEWGQNYVRRNAVIVLSGSYAQIPVAMLTMGSSCKKELDILLNDARGNPLPAGTGVSVANNSVYYTPNGATTVSLAAASITAGTPVLNTLYATWTTLTVNADCSAGAPVAYPAGTVDVIVTTPKGNNTTIPVTVN